MKLENKSTGHEYYDYGDSVPESKVLNERSGASRGRGWVVLVLSFLAVLLLVSLLILWAFFIDLGRGALLNVNQEYFDRSIIYKEFEHNQGGVGFSIDYSNGCPSEQVELITDKTTLNGATVSCWPNTVSGPDYKVRVDTSEPVKSVVCPPGKWKKYHHVESNVPQVKVSCR